MATKERKWWFRHKTCGVYNKLCEKLTCYMERIVILFMANNLPEEVESAEDEHILNFVIRNSKKAVLFRENWLLNTLHIHLLAP